MRLIVLLVALFLAIAPVSAQLDPKLANQGLFPFVLPAFDDSSGVADVSFLNDKPAGSDGFVAVKGEHFVDGTGKPLRFWGVNLNFSGVFPPKEEAPKIAARLAKFGFNSVRIHHFEGNPAPNGIWQVAAIGSTRLKMPRAIDETQLDRFDFFAAELIKRGIYLNFNLHVARKVTDFEGFPNAQLLPEKDKGIAAFFPRLEESQKDFARWLLEHQNPYTGRAYKDEPGVCALEVSNENSLLGMWLDAGLGKILPPYSDVLRFGWNKWLLARYGTDENLRRAWTELNVPLGQNELLATPRPATPPPPAMAGDAILLGSNDGGVFNSEANDLRAWKLVAVAGATGRADVDELSGPTANGFVRPGLNVSLSKAGNVSWAFQLNRDGINWQDGQPYTFSFWARASSPRRVSVNTWTDRNPVRFLGFTGFADLRSEWQFFSFVFQVKGSEANRGRLALNFGNLTGMVQVGAVSLRSGGIIAAPAEWSLITGVPLLDYKTTSIFAARRDFAQFLGELEIAHAARMRQFLKEDLGVKVPIWQSQAQFGAWGGVLRESASDAIDVHAYWKHPNFGGANWSNVEWRVENQSMTKAAGADPLSQFALARVAGKPFVMTEWNSGQPNDFGAESLLMAAAYGAWQDWAGIWVFDFHSSGSYDRDRFDGYFSIDGHPAKMATSPLAALIFRRGDLQTAKIQNTLVFPREAAWDEAANFPAGPTAAPFQKTWATAGAQRGGGLLGRYDIKFGDGLFPMVSRAELGAPKTWQSDTGEIVWNGEAGQWKVDAPRSKAFAGFFGASRLDLGEATFSFANSPNNFAAGGLSSLDGEPISQSKKLLLILAGRVENPNMGWNADRTSVGNAWGKGPVHAEGIAAQIRLLTDRTKARVFVLDERGQRRVQVPSKLQNGVLKFEVSALWRTLWYEVDLGGVTG